ncbi:CAP domain-containing protein [Sorangium sp. So ce726]|uniref:CAP domain-containing protein n=1 Tax=Sorangium sp. So ce726 TaxID=3133319 RepID=UPI003F648715
MSALHRTLVLAFIAGCSAVGCLASTEVDEEPSVELSEDQSAPLVGAVCDTASEGADVELSCPAGEVITAIQFASYGRPRGVCGGYAATSCNAPTSKAVVERACVGKASCTVRASNATFSGDPCRRTAKRLYVQAACGPATPGSGAGGSTSGTGGSTSSTGGATSGTGGAGGATSGTGGAGGSTGSAGGAGGSTGSAGGEGGATSGTGGSTGGEVCGNGVCGAGEDCSSCSSDCGTCQMCSGAGPSTTPLDTEEQAFLTIINQYRAQNGLGALSACTSMSRAAQGHSEDMRDQNYFSHTSLDGRTPWTRMCNACYELGCGGTAMAENIAAGNSAAQATFTQWKNSDGHNKNMLGSAYKVIGIGRATGGGTYGSYWTTVFGGASEASCN